MEELTINEANGYLSILAKRDVSESLLNMVYSAIKLYYDKVAYVPSFELHKMKRPRKGQYLPTILSRQEVDRMFESTANTKHLCILYTLYGAGLRLAELLHLRIENVMWDRKQIMVKGGKGKKDRVVMLSDTLKALLELYFDEYQPEFWLFEGVKVGTKYSPKSVQNIVSNAAKKANIGRRVTPHTLRHCFATHLMDGGLDSRYIQELLGHKDIKTTLIYTHVTNSAMSQIVSPLDFLNKNKERKS
jgi:site-specific recombinase XerD